MNNKNKEQAFAIDTVSHVLENIPDSHHHLRVEFIEDLLAMSKKKHTVNTAVK